MRLIKADSLTIEEFADVHAAPPYAILSHTWGEEECSLRDVREGVAPTKKGFAKIKFCCDQALQDGLAWAWVDTCCIDKTSSAELSEAINSMFKWYQNAAKCYAYLSDVHSREDMSSSRWFTRGWTLQELIAPRQVIFYSTSWTSLGTKDNLSDRIHHITGVDEQVLKHGDMTGVLNAVKMSWASQRRTTRLEDHAYCLLGIFDVNLPLLYGEGEKAFVRLQQAVLAECTESSLLAWGLPLQLDHLLSGEQSFELKGSSPQLHGPFADSCADFTHARDIIAIPKQDHSLNLIVQRGSIEAIFDIRQIDSSDWVIAKLPFTWESRKDHYVCLLLVKRGVEIWARLPYLLLVHMDVNLTEALTKTKWAKSGIRIAPMSQTVMPIPTQSDVSLDIREAVNAARKNSYRLDVECFSGTTYQDNTGSMTIKNGGLPGLIAVLFFDAIEWKPPNGGSFAIVFHKSNEDALEGMGINHFSVLRPDFLSQDFEYLLTLQPSLVKYCGTKAQIESSLRTDSTICDGILSSEAQRAYHTILRKDGQRYTPLAEGPASSIYTDLTITGWDVRGIIAELRASIEFVSRTLLKKDIILHCSLDERQYSDWEPA